MILSDRDIKDAILRGEISIEPFNKSNLTPNGYDLTINDIYIDGETVERAIIKHDMVCSFNSGFAPPNTIRGNTGATKP